MTNEAQNMAEQAFLAAFAAKADAVPNAAPTTDSPAPVPASEKPSETVSVASDEPQGESPAADEQDSPASDAPAAQDSASESDDEGEDDEQDEDEESDDEPETPPSEAAQALTENGAKLTLDDVPEAARPFVQQRIKELEAGLTRARQKDTAALVEMKSEFRFQQENPADHVVALLRASPALAEQVNAKLDALDGNPEAAKDHASAVEHRRNAARTTEQTAADAAQAEARATEENAALDARLADRLDAAKVDATPALELSIANQIALNERLTGRRHITAEQVDALVDAHIQTVTAAVERGRRLERRNAAQRRVQDTVATRRTASPIRPGAGDPPGVGRPAMPKNDDEFAASFAAR